MPNSKNKSTKTKQKVKTGGLRSKYQISGKQKLGILLAFALIGGVTLFRSLAATPLPTGAYQGAAKTETKNGKTVFVTEQYINDFAATRLNKPSADYALDFLPSATWSDIEGPAWQMGPWGDSTYRQKMIFSIPMLPSDTSTTLAQGASGDYNTHFKKLAQNLVNSGMNNAVLRLGWEFNGNWYRWGAAGKTTEFKNYWKQIVATMSEVPGANFKFNWNPTNGTGALAQPEQAYVDGDYTKKIDGKKIPYIDQIGLDVYNQSWVSNYNDPSTRWNDVYMGNRGVKYWVDFAASHGKPISFPEWGTGLRNDAVYDKQGKLVSPDHGGGDDATFIQKMYEVMSGTNTAFNIYWDYEADDYNAALYQYPNAAKAFSKYFGSESNTGGSTPTPPTVSAPVVTLTAKPTSITSGNATTLTWTSTDKGASCTASDGGAGFWNGLLNVANGSAQIKPSATATYTISCKNSGGSDQKSVQVKVSATQPTTPVPTVTLTASPTSITKGKSSTLRWSSSNATSCTASGGWSGTKATTGTALVTPSTNSSYTLSCTGSGGKASVTAKVTVTTSRTRHWYWPW